MRSDGGGTYGDACRGWDVIVVFACWRGTKRRRRDAAIVVTVIVVALVVALVAGGVDALGAI
jgi:hypothetical protein